VAVLFFSIDLQYYNITLICLSGGPHNRSPLQHWNESHQSRAR